MSPFEGTVTYGGTTITYEATFVSRKTLEIAVHPDSRVVVKAPNGTRCEAIESRLKKRARWILRQMDYFQQFDPRTPPRQYVGGETHRYLGRQYRLKLTEGTDDVVKLVRGHFWITSSDRSDAARVKSLLWSWYRRRAHEKFAESFERCWPDFERQDLPRPQLKIRRMNTRWGSLSKSGTLTLNVSLIQAPRECIDYVITHELCHLKHHDHSATFYRLLEKVMPDWERRKHKLELALI
ncbi:MAG: M48 family metallopeptidase [Candidatus Thiodiazotropha sp. (ex Lucinoma kastoroae)]|nr:M48 family metallopeptidase [Candidatus Thiodiazotropha sp. (ex Lucinoma kastoroae)]